MKPIAVEKIGKMYRNVGITLPHTFVCKSDALKVLCSRRSDTSFISASMPCSIF